MPELPDMELYAERIAGRIRGERLEGVRLRSPFLLRTVEPPLRQVHGKIVLGVERQEKRLALELEGELFLVLHLMIAGRLHWRGRGAPLGGKASLAAFDFPAGSLVLTEASTKKRAALHLVRGREALLAMRRGGIEVEDATLEAFREALVRENHTVKRALTDPRLFSGIGNAYSDEILHRARMSPVKLTRRLSADEIARLFDAARTTLLAWTERLRAATPGFPEKVTAFRPEMAVHGRHGRPCPACGAPVQRIVFADNETNYCAPCQTGGRLLADRALSRLLGEDWPGSLDEMETLLRDRRL